MSALSRDYYSRLEQGRVRSPSAPALTSLARAIRLTGDEQDYLFRLAGQQPPEPRSSLALVDPAMMYLLDALQHTPAQVADDLLTVVAQNRAARNLLGVWTGLPGYGSNVTWRWFADPASREGNDPAEHERIGRAYAADLRAGVAQRPARDRFAHGLVADLLERSVEFRQLWAQHQVVALTSAPKRIRHPLVGELDLQCDVVLSPATGHRLILFRPRPGSKAHEQIAFLDVLGNQKFA